MAKAKHSVVIAVPKVKFKYKPSIMSTLATLLHNGVAVAVHIKENGANETELANAGIAVVCNRVQTLLFSSCVTQITCHPVFDKPI